MGKGQIRLEGPRLQCISCKEFRFSQFYEHSPENVRHQNGVFVHFICRGEKNANLLDILILFVSWVFLPQCAR